MVMGATLLESNNALQAPALPCRAMAQRNMQADYTVGQWIVESGGEGLVCSQTCILYATISLFCVCLHVQSGLLCS